MEKTLNGFKYFACSGYNIITFIIIYTPSVSISFVSSANSSKFSWSTMFSAVEFEFSDKAWTLSDSKNVYF